VNRRYNESLREIEKSLEVENKNRINSYIIAARSSINIRDRVKAIFYYNKILNLCNEKEEFCDNGVCKKYSCNERSEFKEARDYIDNVNSK
jgi:uncharacterized protein YqfB (UPF0267 family)